MLGILVGIFEVVKTAVSIVSSLSTTLGKGLISFSNMLNGFLVGLGLIKEENDVNTLGDKKIQATESGVVPENFSTYGDYLKALEDFEVDPERSLEISDDEKLKAGTQTQLEILVDKFGPDVVKDMSDLMAKNLDYFEKRAPLYAEVQVSDSDFIPNVTQTILGKESDIEKYENTLDKMCEIEKKVEPEKSIIDVLNDIKKMQGE